MCYVLASRIRSAAWDTKMEMRKVLVNDFVVKSLQNDLSLYILHIRNDFVVANVALFCFESRSIV